MPKITHDLSKHPLYSRWQGIKQRCYNKKEKKYKDYGGRGISMCDEWRHEFTAFYDWCMSNGFNNNLHIDRINNDGNYEPNNCQFITLEENNAIGKQRLSSKNKTGFSGICLSKRESKYRVKIGYLGNMIELGMFKTLQEAIKVRINAEIHYYGRQITEGV